MKELTEAEKHVTEESCELLESLHEKQKELTEYQTNVVMHKKICIRPASVYSSEANRERSRNTRHVFTVSNQ